MENTSDFLKLVQRLGDEARANRKFEGFLRDISNRDEVSDFISSDDFHTKYRVAKIQIEAVEIALLMYLLRIWDNASGAYLSIRRVREALDSDSPILIFGESHQTNDRTAEATGRNPRYLDKLTFERRKNEWINEFDDAVAKYTSLLDRLRIFRDTDLAHALQKSQSAAGKNEENFDDKGRLKSIFKCEVLELAADTGDLIDGLSGIIDIGTSSNPDKLAKIFGDQYWNDFVNLPK